MTEQQERATRDLATATSAALQAHLKECSEHRTQFQTALHEIHAQLNLIVWSVIGGMGTLILFLLTHIILLLKH